MSPTASDKMARAVGPAAASQRTAASMEKGHGHSVLPSHRDGSAPGRGTGPNRLPDNRRLSCCPSNRSSRSGDDPAPASTTDRRRRPAALPWSPRRPAIVNGFKQRNDRQMHRFVARVAAVDCARPFPQPQHGEHVAGSPGHADHVATQRLRSAGPQSAPQQAQERQRFPRRVGQHRLSPSSAAVRAFPEVPAAVPLPSAPRSWSTHAGLEPAVPSSTAS